ncbi:sequence-specific DNA binding transcription factor [Forsythia ovata]|uniref:Sequence-specific DNA binding transcription factor n=1 Tax=Forsythia ovata TaxID=205694 RepID=A0ABD1WX65_9LAMI
MPGGMYSSVNPGILGLEMSLNHHVPPKNPKQQQHPHNPMATYSNREGEYHPQTQQSVKQGYPYAGKARSQTLTLSDDDEPGPENISDDGNMRTSPWQRVKWTDNMVRLLIMVVFYIGDEVGSEGNDPANKKKGGGVLQKKGKWKSVSRAMMEKGFYVSPQQCEDKFNDLNKRYKRVNDILGKGTACRVVENQSLLDSMDHLSPKMKEEVKKLLNSKHLFFREMCAYHNSCGHGSGASGSGAGAGGNQHSPAEVVAEPSHTQFQSQQQRYGTKSPFEKRQWTKARLMHLEDQRVDIQSQAFELEKQRLKWLKFSSKKEREMEREKLANEQMRLQNERMVLLIRQKELELLEHHHHHRQQLSSNKMVHGPTLMISTNYV